MLSIAITNLSESYLVDVSTSTQIRGSGSTLVQMAFFQGLGSNDNVLIVADVPNSWLV
ncbi:hypothetical protein IFO70_30310 [Phormidium tenue FACHB-886]|nr:hypothetical protein [Phormidium tenue FACHB-886]